MLPDTPHQPPDGLDALTEALTRVYTTARAAWQPPARLDPRVAALAADEAAGRAFWPAAPDTVRHHLPTAELVSGRRSTRPGPLPQLWRTDLAPFTIGLEPSPDGSRRVVVDTDPARVAQATIVDAMATAAELTGPFELAAMVDHSLDTIANHYGHPPRARPAPQSQCDYYWPSPDGLDPAVAERIVADLHLAWKATFDHALAAELAFIDNDPEGEWDIGDLGVEAHDLASDELAEVLAPAVIRLHTNSVPTPRFDGGWEWRWIVAGTVVFIDLTDGYPHTPDIRTAPDLWW